MLKREKQNMWLLIAGLGVSRIGTLAFSFAIGLYILNLTGSSMSFAISLVLSALPRVIISPIAGIVADRYSKKMITVLGDIFSGLIVLSLLLQGEINVMSLYVVIAGLAIVNTFFDTAIVSSMPNLVKKENLMSLNSYQEIFRSVAAIGGPMLGGFLFGFGTLKLIIIINGLSFILSGLSEMFIDFKFNSTLSKEEREEKKGYGEVVDFLKENRFFILMLVISLSYNFLITLGINVPHTYLMNNVLGLDPRYIGIIEALIAVGMITGAIIVSKIPAKRMYSSVALNCILLGVVIALAGFPYLFTLNFSVLFNVVYQSVVLFLAGVILSIINIPIGTKMQLIIPEKLRGRVFSLFGMIGTVLVPVGLLLSGALIKVISASSLMVIAGAIIFVISLFYMSRPAIKEIFKEDPLEEAA